MSLHNIKLIRNMKQKEINIRISEQLKLDFKELCLSEKTTMSNKLQEFIINEIQLKKDNDTKQQIPDLLTLLLNIPYGNITIIDKPDVIILNGKIVDNYDSGGKRYMVETLFGDFKEFVFNNKNKNIYLYLGGCDIKNNKLRLFTI